MSEKFANDFDTTIADGGDGIDDSQTTIGLADAPPAALASGEWRLLVESEIILVTAFSGSSITACTRGAESTSAAAHAESTAATHVLTAGALGQLAGSGGHTISSGAYASAPGTHSDGDLYFPTDAPFLLRSDGTNWEHYGPIRKCTAPPLIAALTEVNKDTCSSDNDGGMLTMIHPAQSGDHEYVLVTAASSPWTFVVGFNFLIYHANYNRLGLATREAASGKMKNLTLYAGTSLQITKMNSPTGYSGVYAGAQEVYLSVPGKIFLKAQDDGTNIVFSFSVDDGFHWTQLYSGSRTDFCTCDQVGLFVDANHSSLGTNLSCFHWALG